MRELKRLHAEGALNTAQSAWFAPPGEERLFDTHTDPFELNNLAADPEYRETLVRLRNALNNWLLRHEDWSEHSEADMVASFRPGGATPVTQSPQFHWNAPEVAVSSPTEGASLIYRLDDGPWLLYTKPLNLAEGQMLEARAQRYGWEPSDKAFFTAY